MAKLTRATAKVFGATATTTGSDPQIGQFGSAKAGTYVGTGDVATIQNLTAWSNGWIDAVTPTQQFPTLPEMTGVHKVMSYQNAYVLQEGIPEFDTSGNTTYYKGSIVKSVNGTTITLHQSIIDDNNTIDLTNTSNWKLYFNLPTQTGQSGKFLTTDGNSPSWASVVAPDLTLYTKIPNYSNGQGVSSGSSIPANGWVLFNQSGGGTNGWGRINGITVASNYGISGVSSDFDYNLCPVASGDVVTMSNFRCTYFPYRT